MSDAGLRLTDVFDSIRKHRNVIVLVTVGVAIAGAVFYLAGPKKFEGKTEFVVRNPMYADRNFIYNTDTKLIDYFANEDDIDRAMLMCEADIVQSKVIKNMKLAEAYNLDPGNRKGEQQLSRRFSKNFNITRTEYKSLIVSYVDVVPERAADVANECVHVLEDAYNEYYKEMRRSMAQSLVLRINEEDSLINSLTDSLVALRNKYGIYDIMSPARYNLMVGKMRESGNNEYARGIEMIQNIEAMKDEIVTNRAKQTTLVNQYKTGTKTSEMPLLKVVSIARPPVSPKGIGGMYTVLALAFIGFFFSTLIMAFADSMKKQGR